MPKLIKTPTRILTPDGDNKIIKEFIGKVNTKSSNISIARMNAVAGWSEPGQRPEFDEYTIILSGTVNVETEKGDFDAIAGQVVIAEKGQWVRYSTPYDGGAEYISVCVPAFSPDSVHRD
ncbi:MAG: cupin [Candidatus Marinimicrobia bacterium]|nr:cupin [Candidatus Neomarinimicrobiota bacterium]